ncbi:MAG: YdcF family protein [Bacteroidota bacterium]
MFLFFTNGFIADEFMRWWEVPAVQHSEMDAPYDVGILLTGMCTYDEQFDRINFNRSSDRLLQTMELYQKGIIKGIFISGGSGDMRNLDFEEARVLYDFLVSSGIPAEDIAYEVRSRNTAENAIESARYLQPEKSDSTYLLITSGYHLRRASACFRKQGFDFDMYSTDRFTGDRKFHVEHLLIPRTEALTRWEILFRETIGFTVYKLKGYV